MNEREYPRLGCAAVVTQGDKILMGIRGKEPNYGKWILPGGGVKYLESVKATLAREIYEETGLTVEAGNLINVKEIINEADHEHRVILYWWAVIKSGNLQPSSDLLDAKFLTREEVKQIIESGKTTNTIIQVLKDIGWS